MHTCTEALIDRLAWQVSYPPEMLPPEVYGMQAVARPAELGVLSYQVSLRGG